MPAAPAKPSAEFASLALIRASLKASVAKRGTQPKPSADFAAVTNREAARFANVEEKLKALSAADFAALLKAEKASEAPANPNPQS